MKKFIAAVLAVCVCLSLAGCSKGEANPSTGYRHGDVVLGQYKGLKYPAQAPVSVSQEEIDAAVKSQLVDRYPDTDTTEGVEVKEGDTISISYDGKRADDGSAIDKNDNYQLTLGTHTFIDDFEEQLMGKKVGETVSVNVTFPESYSQDTSLENAEAVFEVVIKGVVVPTTYSDELVAAHTSYKTMAEYNEYIKASLTETKEADLETERKYYILRQALKNAKFKKNFSADIAQKQVEMINALDTQSQNYYGVDGKTAYSAFYGLNEEQFYEYMEAEATVNIEYLYLLSAIADAENINATEEEVDAYAEEMRLAYGLENTEELYSRIEANATIPNPDGRAIIKASLECSKAAEIMYDTAVSE